MMKRVLLLLAALAVATVSATLHEESKVTTPFDVNGVTGKRKLAMVKSEREHEYHGIQPVRDWRFTEDHTMPEHNRRYKTHEVHGTQVRVNHKGHYLPHGDSVGIHFNAHGHNFKFDAKANHDALRHTTKHFVHHGTNPETGEAHPMTTTHPIVSSYLLETHHTHASLNLASHQGPSEHAGNRHIVSGLIYREGTIYELAHMSHQKLYMPPALYARMLEEARPHGGYVMWVLGTETKEAMSLNWVSQRHYEKLGMSPSMNRRRLLQLQQFQNCFQDPNIARNFALSMAGDVGYVNTIVANGETALDRTKLFVADVSFLYSRQMNIYVEVAATQLMTTDDNTPWNNQRQAGQRVCDQDIGQKLNAFRTWMNQNNGANKQLNNGGSSTWHLMTDCYPPPGTVGLAALAGGCSSTNASGVNTLFSRTSLTVAHELGHNYNAQHSFENGQGTTYGIMDYGDGRYLGEYQFHRSLRQEEMCAWIRWAQNVGGGNGPCFSVRPAEVTETEAQPDVKSYAWVASADGPGPCSASCGPGTQVTPHTCQETVTSAAGAVVGTPTVVSNTLCLATPKPNPIIAACPNPRPVCPSLVDPTTGVRTAASCGGHGECMPSTGACCVGCLVDAKTPSCVASDPIRDAIARNTLTGKILHFRGAEYSQFASISAKQPEVGYPRSVSDLPDWPAALRTGSLDAICSRPGGSIFIFKGQQYWEYVFGSGSARGYPKPLLDFDVPAGWTSVHAAVGYQTATADVCTLIRNGEYVSYDFARVDRNGNPAPGFDSRLFPVPVSLFTTNVVGDNVSQVDAAVTNGADIVQLHKAGSMWAISQNDRSVDAANTGDTPLLGSPSRTPSTGSSVGCQVFNCRSCEPSNSFKCAAGMCDAGFKLVRDGSRCTPEHTMVEILFDSETDKYDASFFSQTPTLTGWADGRVSRAANMGRADMIHMIPIGQLLQFEFTMSIKPNAGVTAPRQTLFHADGQSSMSDQMGHTHVQLLPGRDARHYLVTMKTGSIDVTTTAEVSADEFNTVRGGVDNGNMYIEANGQRQSVSFQISVDGPLVGDQTSETVKVIRFDTWRLGAHTVADGDGFQGLVDHMAIESKTGNSAVYTNANAGSDPTNPVGGESMPTGSSTAKDKDDDKLLLFIVIIACALLLLVGVGISIWCCMRKNQGSYRSAGRHTADISFGSSSRL